MYHTSGHIRNAEVFSRPTGVRLRARDLAERMGTTLNTCRCGSVLAVFVACALLIGCGDAQKNAATPPAKLTASQRDSVTAASRLPGAGAMKRALGVADSAAASAARVNEASK
jgi:hypothetical protein